MARKLIFKLLSRLFRVGAYCLLVEEITAYLVFLRFLITSTQFQLISLIIAIGLFGTWLLTILSLKDFLSSPSKSLNKDQKSSLLRDSGEQEKVRNETAKIKNRIELLKKLQKKQLSEVELATNSDLKSLANAGRREIGLRIDGLYLSMLQNPSWCFNCQMIRPPRTTHCPLCDRCVVKRDHHCYVSGGCVGEDNFLKFVRVTGYVILFSSIFAFHLIIYYFRNRELRNSSTVIFDYFLLVNMGLAVLAASGLGLLFAVSIRNATRNVTGVENKNMYIESKNPFALSKIKENLAESFGTSNIERILLPNPIHTFFEKKSWDI